MFFVDNGGRNIYNLPYSFSKNQKIRFLGGNNVKSMRNLREKGYLFKHGVSRKEREQEKRASQSPFGKRQESLCEVFKSGESKINSKVCKVCKVNKVYKV